jgi:predicted RND superfamily exporter protein
LHTFICRFHKHIIMLSIFLTVVAILLTTRLHLDLNLFSLLPSDNPGVNAFFEIAEDIGVQSSLIALVEMPPNFEVKKSEAVVDRLAKFYARSPLIHEVEYKNDARQLSDLFQSVVEYFPLFLKEQDLKRLVEKFSDDRIREQIRENKKILTTPFGIVADEWVYMDPLSLRDLISSLTVPTGTHAIKPYMGYYRTPKGIYILFITPKKPPQDMVFSKKLMAEVRDIEKIALSGLSDGFQDISGKITISYTGGYPIAVSDEAVTKKDIKVTLLTSFLGVMLLFGLSFRTFKILFFVWIPLALSLLWTLGFASLAFRHLNILTCIFSCILIGLGIDFAIHIVNRYLDPSNIGMDASARLQYTFRESGMGIVIGGITTAAAFYSIGISDFKGFKELGILTGTGVLICLAAMMFLLPALLVFFSLENDSKGRISIADFGLKPLLFLIRKYPRIVLTITVIFICLSAITCTRIGFDDNLRNFRTKDHSVLRMQDEVTRWLGASTASILLITRGTSEVEVLETGSEIFEALGELEHPGMIAGVRAINQYILPPSRQRHNMDFMKKHPDAFDIDRIRRTFYKALEENGFEKLAVYERYFDTLSRTLSKEKVILPSDLRTETLDKFLKLFFFRKKGRVQSVTYILPSTDLWSHADTSRFKDMIVNKMDEKGIDGSRYILTGANLLTGDLKELIIKSMKSSLWLAGLSISAVLLIYYRNLISFAFSILPLMIGLGMLSGIMAIFRLEFNFINLIVLPMLVGIGIDDGVHFTNTYLQPDRGDFMQRMNRTGRAAVLTSLTTLVGFGSIALSHYPGLKSMGYVAIIGISTCLFASIIVLPAVFTLSKR